MAVTEIIALILGEFIAVFMVFVVLVLWLEGDRRLATKTLITVGVTYLVIKAIKWLIPSPRPFELHDMTVLTMTVVNESFPSNHTGVAFAIATSVWLAQHRLGIMLLGLAVLVGIGRVLLWVHFPIDVVVGGAIGAGFAFIFGEIFKTRKRALFGKKSEPDPNQDQARESVNN